METEAHNIQNETIANRKESTYMAQNIPELYGSLGIQRQSNEKQTAKRHVQSIKERQSRAVPTLNWMLQTL